jgi:hypothetical protein
MVFRFWRKGKVFQSSLLGRFLASCNLGWLKKGSGDNSGPVGEGKRLLLKRENCFY